MNGKPNSVRIAGVIRESIVDGPGIRFVIFAQGCPHRCKGCHNEATLDFSGGIETGTEKLLSEIEKSPLTCGVTFSGGEPFCQPDGFNDLAGKLKEKNINIIAYTGYTYEELLMMQEDNSSIKGLLNKIDILIDGRFVLEKKDLRLQFKGSSNQRYIDMNATGGRENPVVLENL